jgi:hypothetical protein
VGKYILDGGNRQKGLLMASWKHKNKLEWVYWSVSPALNCVSLDCVWQWHKLETALGSSRKEAFRVAFLISDGRRKHVITYRKPRCSTLLPRQKKKKKKK